MDKRALNLSVNLSAIRYNDESLAINGRTTDDTATEHDSKMLFSEMVGCRMHSDVNSSEPHAVYLTLVTYTDRHRKHVRNSNSLRFAEFRDHESNWASCLPYYRAVRERIAPLTAPHMAKDSLVIFRQQRTFLVLLTNRTEQMFLKRIRPLLDDCDIDYRIGLIGNRDNLQSLVNNQDFSKWDGLLLCEDLPFVALTVFTLMHRLDRQFCSLVPIIWCSLDADFSDMRFANLEDLKDVSCRARFCRSIGRPSYVHRSLCHVESSVGHRPLVDVLTLGYQPALDILSELLIDKISEKSAKRAMAQFPSVRVRVQYLVDEDRQDRRVRWRRRSRSASAGVHHRRGSVYESEFTANGVETTFDEMASASISGPIEWEEEYLDGQPTVMVDEPDALMGMTWRARHVPPDVPPISQMVPRSWQTIESDLLAVRVDVRGFMPFEDDDSVSLMRLFWIETDSLTDAKQLINVTMIPIKSVRIEPLEQPERAISVKCDCSKMNMEPVQATLTAHSLTLFNHAQFMINQHILFAQTPSSSSSFSNTDGNQNHHFGTYSTSRFSHQSTLVNNPVGTNQGAAQAQPINQSRHTVV